MRGPFILILRLLGLPKPSAKAWPLLCLPKPSAKAWPLLPLLLLTTPAHAGSGLQEVKDFGPDPGNLRMFVHGAAGTATARRPLVVVLHGCTQRARRIAALSGWNDLADRAGCLVLYVQQRPINNSLRCFNWFRPDDILPEQGEVGSVTSMVRHAVDHLGADPQRVYLYGVSSGGALAAALMACAPDLFAHVAIFAGAPYRAAHSTLDARLVIRDPRELPPATWAEQVTRLHPDRQAPYPPLLVLHGTRDQVVGFGHGLALVAQWTAVASTDSVPDAVDTAFRGLARVERREYRAGDRAVVTFFRFEGLGHQLPIDPGDRPDQGGRRSWVSRDVDLHSTWLVAQAFGLVD